MLIEQLSNQCKDKGKIIQNGRLFLIQQNLAHHGDFLTMSWVLNELQHERKVVLITFRENYAHYLSISKKLGKSIQPYLKSKKLKIIQCFQCCYCTSQLPLTQTSPLSYISPPTIITKLLPSQLLQQQNLFDQNSFVVIDSIGYLDQDEIVFKIYQEAMAKECRILMAGARQDMKLVGVIRGDLDLYVKLQNDVGNYGRIKLFTHNWQITLLWKFQQGKFQLNQHVKL